MRSQSLRELLREVWYITRVVVTELPGLVLDGIKELFRRK